MCMVERFVHGAPERPRSFLNLDAPRVQARSCWSPDMYKHSSFLDTLRKAYVDDSITSSSVPSKEEELLIYIEKARAFSVS